MQYKNEKDFVCRTKHNLKLYRRYKNEKKGIFEHEITQLINSFLGLIVFIKEKGIKKNKSLETFLEDNVPKIWSYQYKDKLTKKFEEEDHNFINYLRHIRNAIAHPAKNLLTNSENDDIVSITFKDFEKKNKKQFFETTLTIDKIDELIELLTKAFLSYDSCSDKGKINI